MPVLLFALLLVTRLAAAGDLTVEVLDVGQGDSILIQSPKGKTVLIDAGVDRADVVGMLRHRGIEVIDLAIGTHAHADHIGGMDNVLEAFQVRNFADSGVVHTTVTYNKVMQLVEQKGIPYRAVRNGQTYNLDDGIVIEVIHPQETILRGTRSDHNSNSVVIRLTHGRNCFLFTGDAEEPTERAILANGLEPCNVLKVAHHGGRHSSTTAFLTALQPDIAVISVGQRNSYGHPTPEAIARLETAGAKVYRTDLSGTIRIVSDKRKLVVTAFPESANPLTDVTGRRFVPGQLASDIRLADADKTSRRNKRRKRRGTRRPALAAAHTASATQAVAQTAGTAKPMSSAVPAGSVINLNIATVTQLDTLPGIGPSKAAAVQSWLEENGPCTAVDQIDAAPGIGPATIEGIRGLVTCGPAADSTP